MKSDRISKLTITNFRKFSDFTVAGLAQVNLITGNNNTGKSSLLEALHISAANGSFSAIQSTITDRFGAYIHPDHEVAADHISSYLPLFHGHPRIIDCDRPLTIVSQAETGASNTITAEIIPHDPDADSYPDREDIDDFAIKYEEGMTPLLKITSNASVRNISFDYQGFHPLSSHTPSNHSSILVTLYSLRSNHHLLTLWDQIVLTPRQDMVLQALRIIEPEIQAISPREEREIYVAHSAYNHPVPLKSFGDGVNRIFGIILSLVCAKDGALIVDEIETGLHYSAIEQMWQLIFQLSAELKVQVFATSHSSDCVQAFSKITNQSSTEGALIKLQNIEGKVYQTSFDENDLEVAYESQLELR